MNEYNDFTKGNILKKLVYFMLPILASLVLQAMYGAVDVFTIGKFGSAEGLSGVSTGSNITCIFIFTIASLSSGVMILIGKYMGEKNYDKIPKVIGGAVLVFGLIGIVISTILCIFAKDLAIVMSSPTESLEHATTYIRVCGLGMIFTVFYNLIACILRGLGDSKLPLLFVCISCVINIVLDFVFVYYLNLDVLGVAIATITAQAVSVILSVIIIVTRKWPFKFKKEDFKFNEEIGNFLKIGLPMSFEELITQISFAFMCKFINVLGLNASSGYAVSNKVVCFVFLIPSAILQSMSSFISQNVGAKREDRAKKAMLTGMGFGGIISFFVMLLVIFKGDMLAGIFCDNPDYIQEAFNNLRGFAPDICLTCVLFSFIGYFAGHAKTNLVVIQGLIQTFLVRLPLTYFVSRQSFASTYTIGLVSPITTVIGIIVNLIFYFVYQKKVIKPQEITTIQ